MEQTDATPIADLYREAAGVIERYGWCQDRLVDEAGRLCVLGAIGVAVIEANGSMADWDAAKPPISDYLAGELRRLGVAKHPSTGPRAPVPRWNSLVCQSGLEAAAMLRTVADLLDLDHELSEWGFDEARDDLLMQERP